MAGLEIVHKLPEPVAAAYANQLNLGAGENGMIVDFGGGTFDVTVLTNRGRGLEPIALHGDDCLGGDDFDQALASHVASAVWTQDQVDITHEVVAWERILLECEQTKRALSKLPRARLRVPDAYRKHSGRSDLDLVLDRQGVEPAWKDLVDRALRVTAEAMLSAGLRPKDLAVVLLVGGTTYVPLVRAGVERMLQQAGRSACDPQLAVAIGAAMVADRHRSARAA
jgi:molecular chaperone DnaK